MPQVNIFQWRQGASWFVLSGGGSFQNGQHEAIDARMLSRNAADGALAYIWSAGDIDTAGAYLQYLDELGGPSSYLVDVAAEDDQALRSALSDAGAIIIGDGPEIERLYYGLKGVAIETITTAFERGTLVMGIGCGADMLGQWVLRPACEGARPGFAWLENAAVLPTTLDNTEKRTLKGLLRAQPLAYGLGIGPGSALAFGPNGRVESWGKNEIAISLGQGYVDDEAI